MLPSAPSKSRCVALISDRGQKLEPGGLSGRDIISYIYISVYHHRDDRASAFVQLFSDLGQNLYPDLG